MSEAVMPFAPQEPGDWLKNAIEREAERLRSDRDALMKQIAPIEMRLAQLDGAMAALSDKPIVRHQQPTWRTNTPKTGMAASIRKTIAENTGRPITSGEFSERALADGVPAASVKHIGPQLRTLMQRGILRRISHGVWQAA